ncbi:hypothetical protein BC941DRAFT_464850 [Chlamydoabsidia padenii]|nr:hypothetical protein BC941DRAFT_464850 [Chlamydoabsidia padenii]
MTIVPSPFYGALVTLVLVRNEDSGKFECPLCKKSWRTYSGTHSHFARFGGKCKDYDDPSSESEIEDSATSMIEMHTTKSITIPETSNDCPRRSFDESILRAFGQSAAFDYEKNKTLWIAESLKLQPFALTDNNQVEEIALMHCDNVASLINKSQNQSYRVKNITFSNKRKWDSSIELNDGASATNIEAFLLPIIHYGPYSHQLSKRGFTQLDDDGCQLLNDDWTFSPQLRFACAQLLAGAIIVNKDNEAVLVNTVEIYNRQRTLDVHRETHQILQHMASELILFIKRVLGGVISHFDLYDTTALTTSVFLDNESIEKANILASDPNASQINRFDLRYQLRQLRSKFQYPSTYLLCRASSIFANDLRSQPYTIFTLFEAPDTGLDSATKIVSKLFYNVANLVRSSTNPTLPKQYVNTLFENCQDGQMKSILQQIVHLYHEDEYTINILDNHSLNARLILLSSLMSASLVSANKSVAENVKSRVLNGH